MELSSKILERWNELPGNAAKLLVWLVSKQGCVEAKNFEDVARANGCTLKVLRGAIKELEAKDCITVERATGRHAVARIQVTHSLLGRSAEATPSQTGRSNTEAKVTPPQTGNSEISTPYQAGSSSVPDVPSEPQNSKPLEIPPKYLAGELSAVARQALEYVGFSCDREYLSRGFVVLLEKFGKCRPWPRPGMLASKIINRCLHWQRKRKSAGENPALYFWPANPNFQKHTAILRRNEREAGRKERARAAA